MDRNEEKLKILRERLRQIKEKDESVIIEEDHKETITETKNIPEKEYFQENKKKNSISYH